MQIILIGGWMRSGKDTIGDYMIQNHGYTRFGFADALKDEVSETYQIERGILDTQEGKATPFQVKGISISSVRELLIYHGMMRRGENIDYWIERVIENIVASGCSKVVIPDFRFPNEFQKIFSHFKGTGKVLTWKVERFLIPPLDDPSERALDDFQFHYRIPNFGSIDDLYERVERVLSRMTKVRYLLLDVDDCLLHWVPSFKAYLEGKSYSTNGDCPDNWDLTTWITDGSGKAIDRNEIEKLVLEHNESAPFGRLEPFAESYRVLLHFWSSGWNLIAVSSCSDGLETVQLRKKNLKRYFGDIFEGVICLPLAASKEGILEMYPPSIYVDDNPTHVKVAADLGHTAFLMKRPWNDNVDPRGDFHLLEGWNDLVSYMNKLE